MKDERMGQVEELSAWERIRLTWRLLRDARVATWMKAAVPGIALLYVVVPIDLIPDFVLGLGQIDDLSIIGISLFAMTKLLPRLAPSRVIAEHLSEMRGAPKSTGNPDYETYIDTSFRYADRPASDSR